jgi:hypothetical protein
MTHANEAKAHASQVIGLEDGWLRHIVGSVLLAAVVVVALAGVVVFTSKSAWQLLGIGRGLIAPAFYHYTGLLIVLGTTFGQFVGWAVGSMLLAYVWHRLTGSAVTFRVVQVSISIVYCGLAIAPIFFYHLLFGQALAGVPRPGLDSWLRLNHPDAYWLLSFGHRVVDLLIILLFIAVLALIWGTGERMVRLRGLQTLVLFLILLTSLAVALSLGIHATMAHIRLGS